MESYGYDPNIFSRKDKHDNFEVFINESVSSMANAAPFRKGG